MYGVRRAGLAGQVGGGRSRNQEDLILILDDLADRERDRRSGDVDDHIDLIDVDPPAHDVRADVGLVLMVGAEDFDFHPFRRGAGVLHRHARGHHRARPRDIGIKARHVSHYADPDDAVTILGLCCSASEYQRQRAQPQQKFHCYFLPGGRRSLALLFSIFQPLDRSPPPCRLPFRAMSRIA